MKRELALFRNISCWLPAADAEEWVDFPGPATLWPDDYDLERFGFGVPPLEKAPLYQRAFEIAVLEMDELEDFAFVLDSPNDLVMVNNYSQFQLLLA
jgi:hypothetical protein